MLVALGVRGTAAVGPFVPWQQMRHAVPAKAGELYVARDAAMEQRWDDVGYSLMEDGEGPFAMLYRPSPQRTLAIQLDEEPYERHDLRFDPYAPRLTRACAYRQSLSTSAPRRTGSAPSSSADR
jgi:hypothetical protein